MDSNLASNKPGNITSNLSQSHFASPASAIAFTKASSPLHDPVYSPTNNDYSPDGHAKSPDIRQGRFEAFHIPDISADSFESENISDTPISSGEWSNSNIYQTSGVNISTKDNDFTKDEFRTEYTVDRPAFVKEGIDFQCVAFSHSLVDAMQTPCGHRVCLPCIDLILSGKSSVMCPAKDEDCTEITRENLNPDYGIRREMRRLDVYCPNRCLGCLTIMKYEDLKHHIEECEHNPVDSLNPVTGSIEKLSRKKHNERLSIILQQLSTSLEERNSIIEAWPTELTEEIEFFESSKNDIQVFLTDLICIKAISDKQSTKIGAISNLLDRIQANTLDIPGSASEPRRALLLKEMTLLRKKQTQQEQSVVALERRQSNVIQDELCDKMMAYGQKIRLHDEQVAAVELKVNLLEKASFNGILLWNVMDYMRKKWDAIRGDILSIYSQPFFTSSYGYKMRARIYLNGDGMGKGTHMSVFIQIMRGGYDALLHWPFRQKITISLMNQSGRRHLTDTFRPDPTRTSFRRPETEMNTATGFPLFVAHSIIENESFVKNDAIFIKVAVDIADLEI